MTAVDHTRVSRRGCDAVETVDIAGTAWPLYKLEALTLGLLLFLTVLVITQVMQIAVLTAAAVTVAVWWARRLHYTRPQP